MMLRGIWMFLSPQPDLQGFSPAWSPRTFISDLYLLSHPFPVTDLSAFPPYLTTMVSVIFCKCEGCRGETEGAEKETRAKGHTKNRDARGPCTSTPIIIVCRKHVLTELKTKWVPSKGIHQRDSSSPSSEGWEDQVQGRGGFCFSWGLLPGLHKATFSLCPHMVFLQVCPCTPACPHCLFLQGISEIGPGCTLTALF